MVLTMTDTVVAASSCILFSVLRHLLDYFSCLPPAVSMSNSKSVRWRWFNVLVSLIHALFAAIGCLYCLYEDPSMIDDLEHRHSFYGRILVTASTGYFFSDTVDFIIGNFSIAVVMHHILVLVSFSVVVYCRVYVAYAIVALLVEVNSIFLHFRQLLRMSRVSDQTCLYLVNSVINCVTFVVFRFFTLIWMTWWVTEHQDAVEQPYFGVLVLSLPLMIVINAVLLYQVLAKDFPSFTRKLRNEKASSNGMHNDKRNSNGKLQ